MSERSANSEGTEDSQFIRDIEHYLSPAPAGGIANVAAGQEPSDSSSSSSESEGTPISPGLIVELPGGVLFPSSSSASDGSTQSRYNSGGIMSSSTPSANEAAAKSIFDLDTARTEAEMQADRIVVAKTDRGSRGSRERDLHYKLTTEPLEKIFGVASYHVTTSKEGESTPGTSHYTDIQSRFVGNVDKLKLLAQRALKFDLMDVITVPKRISNAPGVGMSNKWDMSSRTNLLENWTKVSLEDVIEYQMDINKFSTLDAVSSNWLKDLLVNSMDIDLRAKIQETYGPLEEKGIFGGIVYLKIGVDVMFCMTREVCSALLLHLENFAKTGIAGYGCGENVAVIVKNITVIAGRLSEIRQLPSKATEWVLQGFCLCSTPEFKEPFTLLLNQERVADLGQTLGLADDSEATLKKILEYCAKATTSYDSLQLADKWLNPSGSVRSCWNCGGDHGLRQCKSKKDQARIESNKKKWEQESGKKSGGGGGYERKQFSGGGGGGRKSAQANAALGAASSGLKCENGKWLMHCGKVGKGGGKCGWNCTHSTKFHSRFMKNPSAYPAALPKGHSYWTKVDRPAGDASDGGGSGGGTNSAQGGGGSALSGDGAKKLIAGTKAVFESVSKTTSDPDQAALFEQLAKTWGDYLN